MNYFFDTSSFVKRYVDEIGSEKLDEIFLSNPNIYLSQLIQVELISALSRLKRDKKIDHNIYDQIKKMAYEDFSYADVIHVSTTIIQIAQKLIEELPLKSLDAIHIATALDCKTDYFVTADEQQAKAAKQAGLNVILTI